MSCRMGVKAGVARSGSVPGPGGRKAMILGAKTKKAGGSAVAGEWNGGPAATRSGERGRRYPTPASVPHLTFEERVARARPRPRRSPRPSHDDVFDRAIADFAESYADQNERDHQALLDTVKIDRIQAQTGV
jgi:hypothetical protein